MSLKASRNPSKIDEITFKINICISTTWVHKIRNIQIISISREVFYWFILFVLASDWLRLRCILSSLVSWSLRAFCYWFEGRYVCTATVL